MAARAESRLDRWAERAARARELAARYPASREILLFYAELAEWQGAVAAGRVPEHELLPSLVDLVRRAGPPALREAAEHVTTLPHIHSPHPYDFFGRAARQPFAAVSPSRPLASSPSRHCPACCHPPQVSCLRPEGHGSALELVCSVCFTHWSFPRGKCPACGHAEEGKLAVYSAPDFEHLSVQACDACHEYLIVVDVGRDPLAIPEVDELAALPLDLWAREHRYHKVQPNLAGV